MNDNRMTDRRIAVGEFWEPAPKGWKAPSKHIHRQHTPPQRIDWSGIIIVAFVLLALIAACTADYWGL